MTADHPNSSPIIQPIRSTRLSQIAVDQITDLIESGRFAVGDQLPSERDLVQQLGVSRASVREALRVLELQHLIEVRPGKGAFVINAVSQRDLQPALTAWLRDHSGELIEVNDVREVLESYAASLAAEHAPPEALRHLRTALDDMRTRVDDGDLVAVTHADREFHRLLYAASGNHFLQLVGDSIVATLFGPRHSILRLPHRVHQSLAEHDAVVAAIEAGDPAAAAKAVHAHMASVRHALRALMTADTHVERR